MIAARVVVVELVRRGRRVRRWRQSEDFGKEIRPRRGRRHFGVRVVVEARQFASDAASPAPASSPNRTGRVVCANINCVTF